MSEDSTILSTWKLVRSDFFKVSEAVGRGENSGKPKWIGSELSGYYTVGQKEVGPRDLKGRLGA